MDLLFVLLIFAGGLISGFYGSAVGGGTLLMFPLLIFSGLSTKIAVGTNRLCATFIEASSVLRYHKAKMAKIKLGLSLGVVAAMGSFIS